MKFKHLLSNYWANFIICIINTLLKCIHRFVSQVSDVTPMGLLLILFSINSNTSDQPKDGFLAMLKVSETIDVTGHAVFFFPAKF